MKQYGYKVATVFSRKQIGVLFGMAKRGEIKVERWVMSRFYDLSDFYGMDDNRSIEREESEILSILESAFAGDLEDVQQRLDSYTEHHFGLFSEKVRKSFNRTTI